MSHRSRAPRIGDHCLEEDVTDSTLGCFIEAGERLPAGRHVVIARVNRPTNTRMLDLALGGFARGRSLPPRRPGPLSQLAGGHGAARAGQYAAWEREAKRRGLAVGVLAMQLLDEASGWGG